MKLETLLKKHNALCKEGSTTIRKQNESYRNLEKVVAQEVAAQDFSQNLAMIDKGELNRYFSGTYNDNDIEMNISATDDFNKKFKTLADKFYSYLTIDNTSFLVRGNNDNTIFTINIKFKDKVDLVTGDYIYGTAIERLLEFCKKNKIKFTSSSKDYLKDIQIKMNALNLVKELFENS